MNAQYSLEKYIYEVVNAPSIFVPVVTFNGIVFYYKHRSFETKNIREYAAKWGPFR